MAGEANDEKKGSSILDKTNLLLKSAATYSLVEGCKYVVKIGGHAKTTVVNIAKISESGSAKGNWFLRFDKPHGSTNFAHLNIRHKFSGIPDPHLKLPPGGLEAAKFSGYVCKTLNYLSWLPVVVDSCRLGTSIKNDYNNGTVDKTLNCATDISFTWSGGAVGASLGASIGTCFIPVVGTMVGAAAGSTTGVLLGRFLGERLIKKWKGKEMELVQSYLPWECYKVGRARCESMFSYFSRVHFSAHYC